MSRQNRTENDAFVTDERIGKMAKKSVSAKGSSSREAANDYPCIGGSPKARREMKRHTDMMKRGSGSGSKSRRKLYEDEDDDD